MNKKCGCRGNLASAPPRMKKFEFLLSLSINKECDPGVAGKMKVMMNLVGKVSTVLRDWLCVRRKFFFLAGAARLLAVQVSVGIASTVFANCNPQSPTSPYHTQYDSATDRPTTNETDSFAMEWVQPNIVSGYYLGGVYADTTDYPTPYMDKLNGDQTTTWVMEQQPGNQYVFVQVGFWSGWDNGQSEQLFIEADPSGSAYGASMITFNGPVQGPQYYLTITNGTNGWYNLFINEGSGNRLLGSANMGVANVSKITQADLSSETESLASQMPGGYYDSVEFTNAMAYYNGVWLNFGPGALNYNPDFFNAAIINPNFFAENDTACLN